ncbi:MAG: cation diffusion facilitator family transporter [Vampirovibrionales bacterium]
MAATVLYNITEAVIALYYGWLANSVALVGFGFDSLIEMSASGLVLFQLLIQLKWNNPTLIEKSEHWVHRFVGATFFLLSAYILYEAIPALIYQEPPESSSMGIFLAILSLIIMPALAWGKLKAASHIKSAALRAEAKETIACTILSFILLFGLGTNALFGWWWADPIAGLLMLPWLIKEGLENIQGSDCCAD